MKTRLLARIEKMEAQKRARQSSMVEYGPVKRLPASFTGERHIVIVKRYPTNSPYSQSCEFEERPGPDPAGTSIRVDRLYFEESDLLILSLLKPCWFIARDGMRMKSY